MKKRAVKRPLLAVLLPSFVAGLRQLYLHRWERALAWAVAFLGVGSLSSPDAVAMHLQGAGDSWGAAPLFVVVPLATLDAYMVARVQNRVSKRSENCGDRVCPNCRRAADPSLAFCQWYVTEPDSVPGSGAKADVDAAEGGTRT